MTTKPNDKVVPSVISIYDDVPRRRFGERGSLGFLRILAAWLVIVQLLAYVVIRGNLSATDNALYVSEVCGRTGFDLAYPARILACSWKGTAPVPVNGGN